MSRYRGACITPLLSVHSLVVASFSLLLCAACDEKVTGPPQQTEDESRKRADQVVQQAAEAELQVRHARRLRDIDRLRYEAEVANLQAHLATLRGLGVTLTLVLLAALIWLAVEIRRRRVLAAVVHDLLNGKED